MTSSNNGIMLTIDLKKNRLRIFKSTVRLLGNPELVQLLINPADNMIMVRAAREMTPGGQELHIHPSKVSNDSSYDIYSMSFIRKLQRDYPELRERCSYRLYGIFSHDSNSAVFPMDTLERVLNE